MRIVYRPEAEKELLESVVFYQSRADQLGDKFLATIDYHIRLISASPVRFPSVGRGLRQCVVRKFPFIIIFSVKPDHILVLAVAHTSRHPGYWKNRI